MRLPDPVPKEERRLRWWKDWRSEDFSWASLAERTLAIDGEDGTLQGYWQRNPASDAVRDIGTMRQSGELIADPMGRLWHLAHVPLQWDDGTPTWKADRTDSNWPKFWDIIRARLSAANSEPEEPALFFGVVFGEPPEDWTWDAPLEPMNAKFVACAFAGQTSFAGVESCAGLVFRNCLFAAFVDFDKLRVHGGLAFRRSTFLSTVWMKGVRVLDRLEMDQCDLHGELSLVQSRILGGIGCDRSVFHAPCLFEDSVFRSEAQFSWCRFLNIVSFASVRFRGAATFLETSFESDVTFTGRCHGDFKCVGNRFAAGLDLAFMQFRREAWFAESRFESHSRLQDVQFFGKTSFLNAVFAAEVSFQRVQFKAEVAFHHTVFEGRADLTGCEFPEDARCYHGAFRGADFRRNADFTIPSFTAWGVFIDTSFQQRLLLARSAMQDSSSFDKAFAAAGHAAAAESGRGRDGRVAAEDVRYGELESAFQALKQAMAGQQARLEEHRFYRLELLARRRTSASSCIERGIIRLYDLTSRCGTSFVRPLVALAILMLVFALGYWSVSLPSGDLAAALNPHPPRPIDARLVDAVRFSVENTIQPMSVWGKRFTEADPREAWVRGLLTRNGPGCYLVMRLFATLQSLLSIALLFLAVLGFKRHFQMNT